MKKAYKPHAVALALAVCLCLCGCAGKTDSSADQNPTNNSANTQTDVSSPDSTAANENVETDEATITMEPEIMNVTDITADPEAGYGFHIRTNYGNAFGLVYSYGSYDGSEISNVAISVIPVEMKDIDEILATEACQNINKEELTEMDFGNGITGWMSTSEASQSLVEAAADLVYDELYIQMKVGELAAAGVSEDEALEQAMNNLAAAGIGGTE